MVFLITPEKYSALHLSLNFTRYLKPGVENITFIHYFANSKNLNLPSDNFRDVKEDLKQPDRKDLTKKTAIAESFRTFIN